MKLPINFYELLYDISPDISAIIDGKLKSNVNALDVASFCCWALYSLIDDDKLSVIILCIKLAKSVVFIRGRDVDECSVRLLFVVVCSSGLRFL